MGADRVLRVVTYRYLQDAPRVEFPGLDATLFDDFRSQVRELSSHFEMASIESSLDFLTGEYRPRRDLCLLTFDDGLKEHFTLAAPFLAELHIRGVFFVITSCLEEKKVAPAHMNDFLMASMDFEDYAAQFFRTLLNLHPDAAARLAAEPLKAAEAYPWDTPDAARYKYLFNIAIEPELRDRVVRELFVSRIGPEEEFAPTVYLGWEEARHMQKSGMAIGAHTHQHKPLSSLAAPDLAGDLQLCHRLLASKLLPQAVWPFAYPDGKRSSFHVRAVRRLQELGFHCAFTSEEGDNRRGADLFTISRRDCTARPLTSEATA